MTIEQEQLFARFKNQGFTEAQVEEIRLGLEAGYDVAVYARKGIPAEDMAYIRKYLNFKASVRKEEEKKEPEEDFEQIEKEYEEYRNTKQLDVFEKVIVFAMTIAGLAVIAALYTMVMSWPIIK